MPDSAPPTDESRTAARLLAQGLSPEAASTGGRVAPPPRPEEVQPHFPDLEVLSVIGQGGMGVVYRARQKHLERDVALKILPRASEADPAFAERFGREARALARLEHPHIVRVHDFGATDEFNFLVMEYVDGANLRHVLQEGRMRPEEALAIVPQVCAALNFAHDAGVVHRDIKPENILIDAKGKAKLTDFGLAKLLDPQRGDLTLTGTGQVMGTVQYMAPEQYLAPQDVDHRADIFSLGVVFYEMLTGELPVGRFRPPSHEQTIDRRIDEIVLKALERERELRYQRADDVSADVRGLARPPTPPRVPAAPVAEAQGTSRLSPLLLGLSALALVLGALAVPVLHEAWGGVERGTEGALQRELVKGIAAASLWAAGVLLALWAALRARSVGVRRAAIGLGVVNAVLLPVILVTSGVEIYDHAKSDAEEFRQLETPFREALREEGVPPVEAPAPPGPR